VSPDEIAGAIGFGLDLNSSPCLAWKDLAAVLARHDVRVVRLVRANKVALQSPLSLKLGLAVPTRPARLPHPVAPPAAARQLLLLPGSSSLG